MVGFPRVAFIAGALGQGGAERQLFHTAATLRQCGAQVRVLSLSRAEPWTSRLRQAGVEIDVVGERPIVPLLRILARLSRDIPDIVESSHFFSNPYALAAAHLIGARDVGAINSSLDREMQKPGPITARLNRPAVVDTEHFAPRPRADNGVVRLLAVGSFYQVVQQ